MNASDITRLAEQLIAQYGVDGSLWAAMKAESDLKRDDLEGYRAWMQIGRLIEEIQATEGGAKH